MNITQTWDPRCKIHAIIKETRKHSSRMRTTLHVHHSFTLSISSNPPFTAPQHSRPPLRRTPSWNPFYSTPLSRHPPVCGQTPLKTLPSHNFVCGRKSRKFKTRPIIFQKERCMITVHSLPTLMDGEAGGALTSDHQVLVQQKWDWVERSHVTKDRLKTSHIPSWLPLLCTETPIAAKPVADPGGR